MTKRKWEIKTEGVTTEAALRTPARKASQEVAPTIDKLVDSLERDPADEVIIIVRGVRS